MPKLKILPLFNFGLIPIHYLSILAGRKDKRNDLKKNTPQIKIFNFRALGCQNNLSLTLKFMNHENRKNLHRDYTIRNA